MSQIEYSKIDPVWNAKLIWDKVFDLGVYGKASFVFVDTSLLAYGYEGEDRNMAEQFRSLGWIKGSEEKKRKLDLIETLLKKHADAEYLFVVGHHPSAICKVKKDMDKV